MDNFLTCRSIGGFKGDARDAPPGGPNSFIFMQFAANWLAHPLW